MGLSMAKPRLLILIGGHLATAPRPQKEAAAAKEAGLDVLVRGVWRDNELAREDLELADRIGVEYRPVIDYRNGRGLMFRFHHRITLELYRRFGVTLARLFGVGAPELLKEALRIRPDLTMVHSEAGLWVAKRLRAKGFRVGVDFEDWFSEDLPELQRKERPIRRLKQLERDLLRNANLTLTTTRVLAESLARDAGSPRVPTAIPNAFPGQECGGGIPEGDNRSPDSVSFYWFSQTIGPGRGLEWLAQVLPGLRGNWELHLRGNIRGYEDWFQTHFTGATRDKVRLHGCVSNRDLAHYTASHDVGLALEVPHCRSRDLTAPNKIFEYLRSGLAVVASRTRGQVEVMDRCPEAGWVVAPGNVRDLQQTLQGCIDHRNRLESVKSRARVAGQTTWSWEPFGRELSRLLKNAIN